MNIYKEINVFRRKIMHCLTKNIGKSTYKVNDKKGIKIEKILISRPNHRLGNLLLLTPLVQEVINTFPACKIDLFVKGNLSAIIFENYENVDNIIQLPKKPFSNIFNYIKSWFLIRQRKYDLVINANQNSSSGKLSTLFARSPIKFIGENIEEYELKYTDYQHNAKFNIYNFRYFLTLLGFEENKSKIPFLDLKLDKTEIENGKKIVTEIVKNDKKTICLFTNATGDKCYSETWWNEFYDNIKKEFPDYNIIELLPIENISRLNLKIPNFYSKDIREMGGFIANTTLFIAADSGVMHLSSAVGTPTIGLFSVTDENTYKPYNEGSFSINTNKINSKQMLKLIKNCLNNYL